MLYYILVSWTVSHTHTQSLSGTISCRRLRPTFTLANRGSCCHNAFFIVIHTTRTKVRSKLFYTWILPVVIFYHQHHVYCVTYIIWRKYYCSKFDSTGETKYFYLFFYYYYFPQTKVKCEKVKKFLIYFRLTKSRCLKIYSNQ